MRGLSSVLFLLCDLTTHPMGKTTSQTERNHVQIEMKDAIAMGCKDDQINLNRLCGKYDFIKVDESDTIFKNFSPREKEIPTDAVFVSFPGNMNIKRWSRAIPEYAQFFYLHLMMVNILLLIALPKRKTPLLISLAIITAYYIFVADRSCTIKT